MKRLYIPALLTALIVSVTFTSCKTNEENYRQAYLKAKERENERLPLDQTIYSEIRRQAQNQTLEIDGRAVEVKVEYVTISDNQTDAPATIPQYCIVAGAFKQRFHANSLCSRLAQGGYTGSFVVQTAEPLYYVVAAATDSVDRAVTLRASLATDSPVRLADGYPLILSPVRR